MKTAIIRENNKYNKYMKWHLIMTMDNGGKSSNWYKTKKEAIYAEERTINNSSNSKFTAERGM